MSIFKKIYIFLILYFINSIAVACTLDGRWYDPKGQMGPWTFVQDNTIFTGITDPNKNNTCGNILSAGTINNMTAYFDIYYSLEQGTDCNWSSKAIGTFTEDCYSITGNWTDNHDEAGTFQLNRVPISIIEPDTNNDLIITIKPKMPEFKAVAILDQNNPFGQNLFKSTQQPYTWHLVIDNEPVPGIRKFHMTLEDVSTDDPYYEPDFNLLLSHEIVKGKEVIKPVEGGLVGGTLSLWVYYYKNNNDQNLYPASDVKTYTIKGKNPGQTAIESVLADSMSRQIACQESRYKQFDAAREEKAG